MKTVSENSHQYGRAEHINKTILKRFRSMQIHTGLPNQFWTDAVKMAVYLINKGPSVPLTYGILEEALIEKEVNLNHLCTFGCISYVHVELDRTSKLDPKSKRCIFHWVQNK